MDRTDGVVADGSDAVTVTVTVRDANGKPVSGAQVTVATTGTGNTLGAAAPTDANGVTTARLSTTVAEGKDITATIASAGAIPKTAHVAFVAGAVSAAKSTVSLTPATAVADGQSTVTITVTVHDANDNPVVGKTVVLSAGGSQNTFVQPAATDAHGTAVGTLASTKAESKAITASVGGAELLQKPVAQFTAGDAAQLGFYVQPSTAAAGSAISPAIQVVVQDAHGNRVSNATTPVTMGLGSRAAGSVLSGTKTVAAESGVAVFSDLTIDRAGAGYTLVASAGGLTTATSAPFDITAGPPSKLAFSVQPVTAQAGVALSPALQVQLQDANGNLVTTASAPVTLVLASGSANAVLGGTLTVTAVGGVATFGDVTVDRPGTGFTLAATAPGFTGATSTPFSVTAAPPSRLSFTVQPSNVVAGVAISPAVQVAILDTVGSVVTNDTRAVTLAFGNNAGGGTLSGVLTVNAVNGVATFSNLSVNKAGSGYSLLATTAGLSSSVSNGFDVSPGAAAQLAFATQPPNGTSGAALSPAVRVAIQDAFGNTVTGATSAVSVALSNAPGATLSGTTSASAVAGVATFSNLIVDKAGSGYTLTASSGALSSTISNAFSIAPGAPSKLVFTAQLPASAASGAAFSPAVQVTVQDAAGNPVTGATNAITLSLTNAAGATLSGTTTTGPVGGVAVFSNLSVDKAGSGYALTASSPGLTSATSSTFSITPGAPSKLAFTVQPPVSTASGAALAAVQVTLQDAAGNTVTGATSTITLALANAAGATLSGSTTVSTVNGVATYSNLSVDKAGSGYALTATAAGLTSATSSTFSITPGAPSKLAFTVQPAASAASGAALSPAVQVAVQDAAGNTVTSATGSITLSLANAAGATLSGSTTVSAVNGVATFSSLSVDKVGSGYALTATAAGLTSATSSTFSITPGAPSKLVFTAQPSNSVSGALFSAQVTVQDAAGNTVTGSTVAVTVALTNAGGATLSGTRTVNTSSGVASFTDLAVDKAGSYTLTASAAGVFSATSNAFNITPGAATKLAVTVQPTNGTAGAVLAPAVQVAIEDAAGNVVPSAANIVTVAFTTNPAGGALLGTLSVAATGGVATFSNLSINKAGIGYALGFTSAGLTSATSLSFAISPATASQLVFTTQPPNGGAGSALAPAPQVTVQDAFGNAAIGSSAAITLAIATGPTGGVLSGTATVNAASGVATFSGISLNKVGSYTLSASSGGLTSATSNSFNIAPGAAAQLAFTVQPSNADTDVAISPPVQVAIQDNQGNTVTSSTASVSLAFGTNSGGGTLAGTTTLAAANGVATFSNLSINRAGAGYTLVATSAGLPSVTSNTFTITLGGVTGTRILHYLTDTGQVDVPQDLTASTIGALVADGDGGYTFYAGAGTDAGTFTIPNVPLQTYLLQFRSDFIETSARNVDLGAYVMGRPDQSFADAGTTLSFNITGMTPWNDDFNGNTDDIQLFSSNANLWAGGVEYDDPSFIPNPGDTAFNQVMDYATGELTYGPLALPDATKGDKTYVTHLSTRDAGVYVNPDGGSANMYLALTDSYVSSSLTVRDTTDAGPVSGVFTHVPQNQSYSINWKLAEATPGSFGSFRTAVNPNAQNSANLFVVDGVPVGTHGQYSGTPDLVLYQPPDAVQPDQTVTFTYGNPFTGYAQFAEAESLFFVRYSLTKPDGGVSSRSLSAAILNQDLIGTFQTNPVKPQLSPVQGPLVNGSSAFINQTINTTPVISWALPAVGTPTYYTVRFRELYLDAGGIARAGNFTQRVLTPNTSLQLPAGVLQSGKKYVMILQAVYQPINVSTTPYDNQFPYYKSDVLSALLTVQ